MKKYIVLNKSQNINSFKYRIYFQFQQQFFLKKTFTMASHHNFIGRMIHIPYPSLNTLWPYPQHLGVNTPYNHQFPIFQNHHSFSYVLNTQSIYKGVNNVHCKPVINQFQSQPSRLHVSPPSVNPNPFFQNKNQKNRKTPIPAAINLISDDQEQIQLEKGSQGKNTSRSTKSNSQKALPIKSQSNGLKEKIKNDIKIVKEEEIQTKPRSQAKNHKTKLIIKNNVDSKKQKQKFQKISEIAVKRYIFSQRIVQKQETGKQPFRLSKRQRQLLQVNFLRQSNAIILTGPQFQAKIPKFVTQTSNLSSWLNDKRGRLLSRKYKEDEV